MSHPIIKSILISGSFTKDVFIAIDGPEDGSPYDRHNMSRHTEINFGGCASNIAYGLNALGAKVVLSGALDDPAYATYLARQAIQLVGNKRDKYIDHFVTISDPHSEKVSFFSRGAGENSVRPTDRDIEDVDYVMVSADAYSNMYYHKHLAERHHKPFCADMGPEIFNLDECQILSLLEGADMILMNDREFAHIRDNFSIGMSDLRTMARCVLITHGAEGAALSLSGSNYFEPSAPATYMDSTGAGDAFRASLLYSILFSSCEPVKALRLAHRNAASCLATTGGQNYTPIKSA